MGLWSRICQRLDSPRTLLFLIHGILYACVLTGALVVCPRAALLIVALCVWHNWSG